ncbi:Hypothetical protein SFBmNL_00741 [Candidatus Arthromitus sp. SFB-mouse-NL]|nr:Hypothetical protein SFBmNL_00741 [Candidatus Arthromitus sp. SFB-mouse-NL]
MDFSHFISQNNLELTACNHNRDNTFQPFYNSLIHFLTILQYKAESGKTVRHTLDVFLTADVLDNVTGNFLVIHKYPP